MKKILLIVCAFAAISGSARALEGMYFNTFGGFNFLQKPSDYVGITCGLAFGKKLEQFRFEGEFSYRYNLITNSCAPRAYSLMGNLYYELDCNSVWVPYVGAGFGAVWTRSAQHNRGAQFAYQGIAGICRTAWEELDLALEYRALMINNRLRDNSFVFSIRQYF